MKKKLIILILTIGLTNIIKADTIDFWHINYNDIKIKEFNLTSKEEKREIVLNVKDIKKTDSLTIMYFRDVLYIDCEVNVEIEDSLKFVIVKEVGINIGAPIKISIFDLLVTARKSPFFAYYCDCAIKNRDKFLLFKIIFE